MKLIKSEKIITDLRMDKRRVRRLCRQYGKRRFTKPEIFSFKIWLVLKKNARNHRR
ncbi:hypothetical protein [Escherichia phage PH1062]|nr:hypothetical protein [Escherichia phage PH1062]